jgi:hypothetical protein
MIAVIALLMALDASAQSFDSGEYASFNSKYRVYLGGFYPDLSSEITVNGSIVKPPPIDIEDRLGVENGKLVAWGGGRWRISQRNSLELELFQLKRDGFVDLFPDPVEVGDLVIESGSISTFFDVGISRLTYGFSLSRSERSDLQLKAGLHIADLAIGLQLAGAVCDVSLGQTPPGCPAAQTPPLQTEEVTAPLPHFGLSWGHAFSPSLMTEVRAMGFAIDLNDIDGGLYEISGDVIWRPWENFGVGFGLRFFNVNVKATEEDLNGEFDLRYFGPALSIVANF